MINNKILDYLQRLWYELNTGHIIIGYRFFFRRWQVSNEPKLDKKEALIYVANHQNAFLDAISIIMAQRRHPIFLTRANIFATGFARFLLRSYNMFPVYRKRDGVDSHEKNEKVFNDCNEILIKGRQPIALFVEGNHRMARSLRQLKKGAARIAFSTLEQLNFEKTVKIIPIGVNYSRHSRFRGDLFMNWGEPIIVNDYKDLYNKNPNIAYSEITSRIYKELDALILNIQDSENYEEIEKAWIAERVKMSNMYDELQNDKAIIAKLTEEKKNGLSLDIKPKSKKRSVFKMILGFPAFIYGTLNHLPLIFLMQRVLTKYVTDIHFYGSVKMAGSSYMALILYLLQAFGVYALTDGNFIVSIVYFITLPFFGTFAYDHYMKYYSSEPDITSSAELLKGYK